MVCHELSKLPSVKLNGIISDKNYILIDPPASGMWHVVYKWSCLIASLSTEATEFEPDYTNVKPELRECMYR